ncbi:MAG: allantoinase [Kyrpidia sp.]|nr:allantoinase [Kyrpidia sp.]
MAREVDMVIRNGTVVTAEGSRTADLAVEQGRIAAVERHLSPNLRAVREVDASGLHIFPGLIDTHVHLNEPGRTEWEGFASGTRSLAAGGVTTFFDMPLNSKPTVTGRAGFEVKAEAAGKRSLIDYGLWGGLIPGNVEKLEELHECGVVGFKAFMSDSGIDEFPAVDDAYLWEGMETAARLGSLVAVHAESRWITARLTASCLSQGRTTARDYEASRPILSEMEAVQKAVAFARLTGCPLHVVHASSARVVRLIQAAKDEGADVTVETCPHYLTLTTEDAERLGGVAKCAPPLRSREEVDALWEAVADGAVDTVGSDHSPCPPSMKEDSEGNIFRIWGGISGAQSTLNVLLEEGHHRRSVPLETIVQLASTNPAKRFGLYPQKGTITPGSDADLVLVDLRAAWVLHRENLYYRHPHSPYVGRSFRGRIRATLLRGRPVYTDGVLEGLSGFPSSGEPGGRPVGRRCR